MYIYIYIYIYILYYLICFILSILKFLKNILGKCQNLEPLPSVGCGSVNTPLFWPLHLEIVFIAKKKLYTIFLIYNT